MLVKSLCFLAKQRLLKGTKACKIEFCEHCVLGKQQRVKFGIAIHNTKGILDYVHSDVWGPAKTPSIGGRHYFVTFVEFFGRVWVYTMKNKDDVLRVFLKWKDEVEKQTGRKIKVLRTDNGGEYKSDPFLEVCHDCGSSLSLLISMPRIFLASSKSFLLCKYPFAPNCLSLFR